MLVCKCLELVCKCLELGCCEIGSLIWFKLNDADDFEKPFQELLAEVKTLVSNGKKTDAIDLLQANNEAVKEQLKEGLQSIKVSATLDVFALGFMVAGEDKLAASVLKRLNYVAALTASLDVVIEKLID